MPSLAESVPNKPVILLIGPAGAGKTTFALQFRRPYLVNIDNNLAGPQNYFKRSNLNMSSMRYDNVAFDDTNKPVEVAGQYMRFVNLLSRAVADPTVDTVIIDSTTSLQPVFEAYCLSKRGKPVGSKFSFDEWHDFAYVWTETIAKLRTCGKTVIIIGHETTEKGDIDQVLRWVLAVPGQMGDKIPMLVTDVWRLNVQLKLVGTTQKPFYSVTTIQDTRRPNIKASLTLPTEFEASPANIKLIEDQIYVS